jgi:hypothetical protein
LHLSTTDNDFVNPGELTSIHYNQQQHNTNMAFRPVQRQYPAYGYCESFFVEGNDEGVYARAAAERESVRQINKIKQKALGEELSRATAEEYQEDVLDHMEHMEVCIGQHPGACNSANFN